MGSQLALKSRIRSTESLAKIFNAQEMIASSHIAKARDVALNAKPYTDAIFDAVQALVAHTHITHPIAVKDEKNPRVAVLALTSDRGMAGPYTSSIIRETESLLSRLDAAGKQPELQALLAEFGAPAGLASVPENRRAEFAGRLRQMGGQI